MSPGRTRKQKTTKDKVKLLLDQILTKYYDDNDTVGTDTESRKSMVLKEIHKKMKDSSSENALELLETIQEFIMNGMDEESVATNSDSDTVDLMNRIRSVLSPTKATKSDMNVRNKRHNPSDDTTTEASSALTVLHKSGKKTNRRSKVDAMSGNTSTTSSSSVNSHFCQ